MRVRIADVFCTMYPKNSKTSRYEVVRGFGDTDFEALEALYDQLDTLGERSSLLQIGDYVELYDGSLKFHADNTPSLQSPVYPAVCPDIGYRKERFVLRGIREEDAC